MSSLCDLDTTAVVWIMVVVVCVVWWLSTRRPPGLPPGPGPALPLLGHLHLMKKDPREQFQQWRRQYGDVFSLYLGGRLVVVLNGLPVIKEALVNMADVFSHRPHTHIFSLLTFDSGVTLSSGALWKEQRTTALQILRDLGMGRNTLAEKIQEELTHYIRAVQDLNGAATDLREVTDISVSNNICSIVFGKRFDYDDATFGQYMKVMQHNVKYLEASSVANYFPLLFRLPGDMFHGKKIVANVSAIKDSLIAPQIESHKRCEDVQDRATDFIYAYLRQAKRKEDRGEKNTLDDKNLLATCIDLFFAGSETTSTTIYWALLFFLHYPEVQDRCFEEINDVIGPHRLPAVSDRTSMTYVEATIMEVLRAADMAPFALQHTPSRDVMFRGYVIPKEAMVMPSLNSVLKDPEIWGDPENFRPERFISPEKKLLKPEAFVPFSVGRRKCLGESMARMELFLYISTLVQRFHFLPPEDGQLPPSTKGTLGVVCSPIPFKIRAVPRKQ